MRAEGPLQSGRTFYILSWVLSLPLLFIKHVLYARSSAKCRVTVNDSWREKGLQREEKVLVREGRSRPAGEQAGGRAVEEGPALFPSQVVASHLPPGVE